ncbi:MAG: transposase [Chloroflexi bacterium]|nr:transposase [Chloroflexota bacterium]
MSCVGGAEITLLVDETKLHDRIGVMLVGVAWQGRCLPLAWRTYRANSEAAYPAEGQVGMIRALLQAVKAGIGDLASVLVLADRGIGCSPALCRVVEALGWRYLFRVTCQTKIVTEDADYRIARQVQPGEVWRQAGRVFKQRGRIEAHARALWGVGYDEPWALVTNDERLTGYEYARRNWQEQSFRDLKSGGWHWGDSRLRSPHHVANLLILLAIAYTWMVASASSGRGRLRPTPGPSPQRCFPALVESLSGRTALLRASRSTAYRVSGLYLYPRHTAHLKTCPLLSRIRGGAGGGVNSLICGHASACP